MTPAPLQLGQAPSELALKSAGFTPLAFANALRIGSSSPVYVAGLLRREPRIAVWSIDTTPSPAGIEPWMSELLPEPATPVTTTSTPSGTSTSTSRRLCAVAPRISSVPVGVRTVFLREARSSKWRPVMVPLARSPSTVPSKQTVPPAVPAPGPRSTTWSAIAIVSGSCSTTSTVLPLSRSCSSRSFIRWTSCGCRPMVGSSKTYVTSVSDDPRWRIILVRCASPPDRVPDGRSSERYPNPISANESKRCCSPMSSGATDGSARPRTQSARSLTCIAQASAMLIPAIFDDRASLVSRVPSHSGQVVNVTARSTKARTWGCSASTSLDRNDFWICGIRPAYVRLIPSTLILVGSLYSRSCSSLLLYLRIGLSGSKKPQPRKMRPYQPSML